MVHVFQIFYLSWNTKIRATPSNHEAFNFSFLNPDFFFKISFYQSFLPFADWRILKSQKSSFIIKKLKTCEWISLPKSHMPDINNKHRAAWYINDTKLNFVIASIGKWPLGATYVIFIIIVDTNYWDRPRITQRINEALRCKYCSPSSPFAPLEMIIFVVVRARIVVVSRHQRARKPSGVWRAAIKKRYN